MPLMKPLHLPWWVTRGGYLRLAPFAERKTQECVTHCILWYVINDQVGLLSFLSLTLYRGAKGSRSNGTRGFWMGENSLTGIGVLLEGVVPKWNAVLIIVLLPSPHHRAPPVLGLTIRITFGLRTKFPRPEHSPIGTSRYLSSTLDLAKPPLPSRSGFKTRLSQLYNTIIVAPPFWE